MIEKIKHYWWVLTHMRPLQVKRLFEHVRKFDGYDPVIAGVKYAILYGRFYFEKGKYTDGKYDKAARDLQQNNIIREFTCPKNRAEYIAMLKHTLKQVHEANRLGLISTPNPVTITERNGELVASVDKEQKKAEAAHYQMAVDSLNVLIMGSTIYPKLWDEIFLPQS